MIVHYVAYGILLTDDFGSPLNYPGCKNLVQSINQYQYGDEPDWIASCPSAEDYQMVLGFVFELSKKTNFSELQEKWNQLILDIPKEVQELIPNFPEPDVYVMSGKC